MNWSQLDQIKKQIGNSLDRLARPHSKFVLKFKKKSVFDLRVIVVEWAQNNENIVICQKWFLLLWELCNLCTFAICMANFCMCKRQHLNQLNQLLSPLLLIFFPNNAHVTSDFHYKFPLLFAFFICTGKKKLPNQNLSPLSININRKQNQFINYVICIQGKCNQKNIIFPVWSYFLIFQKQTDHLIYVHLYGTGCVCVPVFFICMCARVVSFCLLLDFYWPIEIVRGARDLFFHSFAFTFSAI